MGNFVCCKTETAPNVEWQLDRRNRGVHSLVDTSKPVNPFIFSSGFGDCVSSNPDKYKVLVELPGARLVEMTLKAGAEERKHDHPLHYMYVVQGSKLSLTPPHGDESGPLEVEWKTGAAMIAPAGLRQVRNVGISDLKVIFVEPLPDCKPCGPVADFISPFLVSPGCYKVLAEDEGWLIGELALLPCQGDVLHHHRDHVMYVLSGDSVAIFENGEKSKSRQFDLKPYTGIAAQMGDPVFAKRSMMNTGSSSVKMIFFEMKQ
eukprot:TRINITY_DN36905_c0_g1_i1.p1 TRINITY_DN36905_c0_g1~~TRINITY_DN36905_c0_g1_i1.p1  ORF type:complete len:261 (+),score=55.04 TRINITY_DN36905_c0_g1_i1:150-932(+)